MFIYFNKLKSGAASGPPIVKWLESLKAGIPSQSKFVGYPHTVEIQLGKLFYYYKN